MSMGSDTYQEDDKEATREAQILSQAEYTAPDAPKDEADGRVAASGKNEADFDNLAELLSEVKAKIPSAYVPAYDEERYAKETAEKIDTMFSTQQDIRRRGIADRKKADAWSQSTAAHIRADGGSLEKDLENIDQEKPDAESPGSEAGTLMFELPPLTRSQKKPQGDDEKEPKHVEAWKILLAVLICMLFAMGSYLVGRVYGATLVPDEPAYTTVTDEPDGEDAGVDLPEAPRSPKIMTALLMGTDQRFKNEMARADTIILVTINLDTLDIHMISIPRDTRTVIAGTESLTKINAAHTIGGSELMRKTVENLLGITVHYYAETNFKGFAKCVDILGGVDYKVEYRMYFPEEGIDLMPGQQKLNGDKALQYVRWRGEPTADIGRIARQQKFIKALLEQSKRLATIPKLPGLINALKENVATDMTGAQMLNLATRLMDFDSLSFESATLPGEAKTIGGGAYWVMDEKEARALIQSIFEPPATE